MNWRLPLSYLAELLGQVLGNLLRNKLRSILTMAGIAWGVASIVLIVAMGDGFKEGQRNNMKGFGMNLVILVSRAHGSCRRAGSAPGGSCASITTMWITSGAKPIWCAW